MKKTLYFLATVAVVFLATACGSSKSQQAADEITDALTVDEVFENPEQYVGDTISIEGICSHLCSQGGKKAFLQGNADNVQIRCEAFPLMGEPFPKTTIHHPMRVTGIFREQRIDNNVVAEMEREFNERIKEITEQYGEESAQRAANASVGCDTERAAQGQRDLNTFKERMDDYRTRIAARKATEGKAYLSFYFMDAISFEILE
ncbi:MAG: hypothetical protein K2K88_07100 [Muribaculaceae bacterium]|nr:hypothetical protein [Muribaculaceae bacterium]MDE6352884.1 hypothetical protein [Muribaculaceae bacterium]MDE6643229.1 hypothetical protein [Muribaculaceae bacterium]